MSYEYRVIPAPVKGTKAKGAKTAEERFALTLQEAMNSMAADGWEFQRAETLPSEERSGLTGRKTVYHNMLVFRRTNAAAVEAFQPREMPPLSAQEARTDAPVPFIRPGLTAVAEPSPKAPPVLSPRALSGSLSGQMSKDTETSRD
ncbi:MAG: hypothetical protein B7X55_07165 [Rhodobacterales bacterium 34-62-10]|nr:MAG: hypothetical protein B7X55_07165 [Rhodobacterales bacterium 34-62-10]